jgi:hypothetical protein
MREGGDGFDEQRLPGVTVDRGDKGSVDLELVEREFTQVRERGPAGPEVIEATRTPIWRRE